MRDAIAWIFSSLSLQGQRRFVIRGMILLSINGHTALAARRGSQILNYVSDRGR
jgi:hypothetical protein